MPHSFCDQSNRHLTYITENEHEQIDGSKSENFIHGKIYKLVDLV